MSTLALLGGKKSVKLSPKDIFTWPIITKEIENAVLKVLRAGNMSGSDVTKKFERGFADWHKMKYGLGCSTGTAALHCAMFGLGIGAGDEVICPSVTYWASCLPVYSLGGTVVFAEIDPQTLCLDPDDIEHRITSRTKAIVAVHYCGYPCDMDRIMEIARRHGVKVIEDVSHAHGALYKGRKVGAIGDVGAMSLMSGKSLAIGEAGILATDDQEIYERALAFGHYERFTAELGTEYLREFAGLPLGGYKYRMHQASSAMGRVQLKHYDARMAEIQTAMNYFWDQLEGQPGIRAHRPPKGSGGTMGGWYSARGLYVPEELGGLSVTRFCQAVNAEGIPYSSPGANSALHTHPLFSECDVYGHGKPTRIANSDRDLRQLPGSLPVSEGLGKRLMGIPWFKKMNKQAIDEYVAGYKKVIAGYKDLLADDPGDAASLGGWHFFAHR